MDISIILEKVSRRREDYNLNLAPPPGSTGQFITTAQAAKILKVNMSRVRQLVADGTLQSHKPVKGRRDHLLRQSQVRALAKKDRKRTGRPPENKK